MQRGTLGGLVVPPVAMVTLPVRNTHLQRRTASSFPCSPQQRRPVTPQPSTTLSPALWVPSVAPGQGAAPRARGTALSHGAGGLCWVLVHLHPPSGPYKVLPTCWRLRGGCSPPAWHRHGLGTTIPRALSLTQHPLEGQPWAKEQHLRGLTRISSERKISSCGCRGRCRVRVFTAGTAGDQRDPTAAGRDTGLGRREGAGLGCREGAARVQERCRAGTQEGCREGAGLQGGCRRGAWMQGWGAGVQEGE